MKAIFYKGEDITLTFKSETILTGITSKVVKYFTPFSNVKQATINVLSDYSFTAVISKSDTLEMQSGRLNIVLEIIKSDGKNAISKTIECRLEDPYQDGGNRYTNNLPSDILFVDGIEITLDFSATESIACGDINIITDRSKSSFLVTDKVTKNVMFEINKFGQINCYGTPNMAPYAAGAINTYRNGNLRIQQTTVGGHFQINMWNDNNELVCRLNTNGESYFKGGNVNLYGNKVTGLADATENSDAISKAIHDAAITALLDQVPEDGNTFKKLYNLIHGSLNETTVDDTIKRDILNVKLGDHVFVIDDGDGKWALYKAITSGVGATYVKLSDPDLLNAAMSAAQIKAAYESNSNTNAFTNVLLAKLNGVEDGANKFSLASGINIKTIGGRNITGSGNVESFTFLKILFKDEYDNGDSGPAKLIDWENGQNQKVRLTAPCTIMLPPVTGTGRFQIKFIQDSAGGRSVTFASQTVKNPSNFDFSAGQPNQECIATFYWDGAKYIILSTPYYN